jgi:hypothetical protein
MHAWGVGLGDRMPARTWVNECKRLITETIMESLRLPINRELIYLET